MAGFRVSLGAFAVILMIAALWLLATDLIEPISSNRTNASPTTQATALGSRRVHTRASIGFIRGDLWADYALLLAAELQVANPSSPAPAIEGMRRVAERAVQLAPIDAAVWLALAETDLRLGHAKTSLEALKMSYYTGPNELDLTPDRLTLATQTTLSDPDLQMLVGQEITTILLFRPDLKPALITAYRGASAQGRRAIEDSVQAIDPAFLASIRGNILPP